MLEIPVQSGTSACGSIISIVTHKIIYDTVFDRRLSEISGLRMTSNIFFYFFSTSAQCYAGIAALALVAIQMRLSFLDGIVTSAKRSIVATIHGPIHMGPIEHDMATFSATEILTIGRQKQASSPTFIATCDALESAIKKIQKNRVESARLLCGLLLIMVIFLLELPFSEHFAATEECSKIEILAANAILILVGTLFLLRSVYRVLGIRLRKVLP